MKMRNAPPRVLQALLTRMTDDGREHVVEQAKLEAREAGVTAEEIRATVNEAQRLRREWP